MRYIILIPFICLLICAAEDTSAQRAGKNITISGTVSDKDKKPVEGAVIFIDKVKTTSVSDRNGHYTVRARSDAAEILVFTLFYGSAEELIGGRTRIDFILGGSSEGHVEPVKPEPAKAGKDKILSGTDEDFASYQNIYDMIRGRFPGVEVTGTTIRVMGSSSLNVSTEPLFVVDGIVVKSLEDISPQTVKTIEVLKGPAASVWGTRGANGVIVITRRTGKE